MLPGSNLTLRGVGINPTRTGMLTVLERMGARVGLFGTPLGGAASRSPTSRCGRPSWWPPRSSPSSCPALIDELPLVVLVASFARGTTVIRGAGELRVKESDRIATVVDALRAVGAHVEALEDGFEVHGRPDTGCAAAGSTPRATTGSRCWAPSPGSARSRA